MHNEVDPAERRTTHAARGSEPPSPASPAPDLDRLDRLISENPQIYSMLVAKVSLEVVKWLEERGARQRAAALAAGSIVVAVLVASGGFIINQVLSGLATSAVSSALEDNRASVIFQSRVAALNFRALRLDQAEGFSQEEADELVQSLASLHESGIGDQDLDEDVRLRNISDLTFAVETIALSFAQADRDDLISQIIAVAPEVADRSTTMTQLRVHMMGRDLIGTAGGAPSWVDSTGTERELYREYKVYVERARQTGYPELYLVFELITRHMEGHPEEEMRQLVADIGDLNDVDRENFETTMSSLVSGSFINSPTAASQRVQARALSFLEDYAETSPILNSILEFSASSDSEVPDMTPVVIGQSERYEFEPEGEVGWYQFSVDRESSYRIDVMSSGGDPIIYIWNSGDLSSPLDFDDDGGAGTNARLELFLDAGLYYLSIRDLNEETGTFSLLVQSSEP